MAKKSAKKPASKPRKKSARVKGARSLDLRMTRSNSQMTIALDKTETIRFTFTDHDHEPVVLRCSQIWDM